MNPNIQGTTNPLAFLAQGGQIPIQGPTLPSTQPQDNLFNNILQFGLPTVGAIGGEALGGPLGAGVGGAGGQALADLLTGKKMGGDVLASGAFSAGGGLLGKVLPGLVGGALGKTGEDLATGGLNLTKSMANKLADVNGEPVLATLTKNGLSGATSESLDKAMGPLYDAQAQLAKNIPFNMDSFAKNADDALNQLKNSPVTSVQNLYDPVNQNVQNILDKVSKGQGSLDQLLSQFDSATKQAQFGSGEWGANRYTGDILRKTMYDTADQMPGVNPGQLKQMGMNLRNLQNISDAAAKREGMGGGGGLFGLPNLLGEEVGLHATQLAGANPLFSLLVPGAKMATGAIRSNPELAGAVSQGLMKAGAGVKALAPILGVAGAGVGVNLPGAVESGQSTPQDQYSQQDNTSQNISPSPSVALGAAGVNLGQPTQQPTQNEIPTSFGTFPRQLPNPTQIANTVPGQPYPIGQYQADVQKWTALAAANPYNKGIQTKANLMIAEADKNKAVNDQWVQQYIQQQGLPADAQDFIRTAQPQWNNLTELHDLLQQKGAANLFQSFLQADPTMQTILAAKDPRYALMFNLLGQQKLAQARLAQGGVPRAYDLALSRLGTGQTAQANLAILDYAMKQFQSQYEQYAPAYGLSLSAIPGTSSSPSMTGNSKLDAILSGGL